MTSVIELVLEDGLLELREACCVAVPLAGQRQLSIIGGTAKFDQ
jgi:hypothetical protein